MMKNFLNIKELKFYKDLTKNFANKGKCLFQNKNLKIINRKGTMNIKNIENLSYNRIYSLQRNYFSKSDSVDLSEEDRDNLLKNLDSEFEKLLDKSDSTDLEKRIKLLSIKLLQSNSSSDIMNLYEEKYIKNLIDISPDEIILIIYFFTNLIDKEPNEIARNLINSSRMKINLKSLLDQITEKMKNLEYSELTALIYSVSVLISKFKYDVPIKLINLISLRLPEEVEPDKKSDIPTIAFSMSSLMELEPEEKSPNYEIFNETREIIFKKVKKYSEIFLSDLGLNYLTPLNISLLCVAWSKINLFEKELQDRIVDSIMEIHDSFNSENIQEVCKIFWSFSNSDYSNEKLIEFINKYLNEEADKLTINNFIDILLSVAFIYRNEKNLISLLLNKIASQKRETNIDMDINSFVNLWLIASKFSNQLKENQETKQILIDFIKFLMSNYDKRKYLHPKNMTIDEVCSIIVSISALNLEFFNLLDECLNQVRLEFNKLSNLNLVQLLCSGKYYVNYSKHSDLYYQVHTGLIHTKTKLSDDFLRLISKTLKNDGLILESPFLV